VGAAYNFKQTNTVLRFSYARTMETPFNENLVLASNGCNDPVVNAISTAIQGYPCLTSPLSPSTRNEFHAGLQQAFGKWVVVDGEYIWKYTTRAYDFSVFGNTPITYPIEWAKSKIPGYAVRVSVPNFHGFTAFTVFSSVAARFVFKDSREVPDTFHLIAEYAAGHTVVLSSSMANSKHIPGLIRGHLGTIIMVDHGKFEGVTDHITLLPEKDTIDDAYGVRFGTGESRIPFEQVDTEPDPRYSLRSPLANSMPGIRRI
jgi:hypothetical protein